MTKDLSAISWEFSGGFSKDIAEKVLLSAESIGVCVRTIPGKRDTRRVSLPEGVFYVRRVVNDGFLRSFLSWLSNYFFGDEFTISKSLFERGVNSPEVLAYGEVLSALRVRRSVTITSEVPRARTLKDFYFSDFAKFSRKEKKEAINEFAGFLRRLHDKGVTHEDPHMGNILVRRNGEAVPPFSKGQGSRCAKPLQREEGGIYEFFLLDVRDCRFKKKISLAERFLNLVLLNLNFISGIEDSLKFSFFRRYCEGLALAEKGGVKNAIDGIEDMTLLVAFETWDKKAARCMGENNLFLASRFGGLLTRVKRPWEAKEGMDKVLSSPDIFLEGKDSRILKNGRTVKAGLVTLPSGEKLFLKRYNRKSFFHTLKNVFKISRARDVWRKSYAAELRGLNVPRPVAYMEERSFGVLKRSYVVSEFIDGARLGSVIEAGRGGTRAEHGSGEFFRYLGKAIGEMHRLGFFHGDLKWSNILVKEGIRPVFYFTDIDGSRVEKRLALSRVEDDIQRFSREMEKYGIPEASKRAFCEGYDARNRSVDAFKLCRHRSIKP